MKGAAIQSNLTLRRKYRILMTESENSPVTQKALRMRLFLFIKRGVDRDAIIK